MFWVSKNQILIKTGKNLHICLRSGPSPKAKHSNSLCKNLLIQCGRHFIGYNLSWFSEHNMTGWPALHMKNSRCVWLIIWYVFVVISKFICHNIKAYLSNTTSKIFWARYYGLTGFSFDVQQPYNGWLILSEYAAPLTYLILVIILVVIIVFVRFQNVFAQFSSITMFLYKFQNVQGV